ncbi:MAG UNVERIFIED_CONTAM: acylneuraminate cytidylyltransferase family protein, partial [Anaerolineae bacterium]
NANILLRTQDLPPVYEEDSLFYLFNRTILQERHNRVGLRPLLFEVDRLEAQDIDEEVNFIVAEMIYHYRQQQASTKG